MRGSSELEACEKAGLPVKGGYKWGAAQLGLPQGKGNLGCGYRKSAKGLRYRVPVAHGGQRPLPGAA